MYIKINNWSSYQSYKDRKPPWIRFHKSMLDNYEFHIMTSNARALLPMLWLLASEDDDPASGLIKDSHKKIAFRLRCTEEELISGIAECQENNFLEVIDQQENQTEKPLENQGCNETVTKPLQNGNETVTPETETETETETERTIVENKFEEFWIKYGKIGNKQPANKSYNKQIKKGVTHDEIIDGLERYQNYCCKLRTERKYIKHANTWLNQEGFRDEYTIHAEEQPKIAESKGSRADLAMQQGLAKYNNMFG